MINAIILIIGAFLVLMLTNAPGDNPLGQFVGFSLGLALAFMAGRSLRP